MDCQSVRQIDADLKAVEASIKLIQPCRLPRRIDVAGGLVAFHRQQSGLDVADVRIDSMPVGTDGFQMFDERGSRSCCLQANTQGADNPQNGVKTWLGSGFKRLVETFPT